MPNRLVIVALAFLAAQAVVMRWFTVGERLPQPPSLASFPNQIAGWKQFREDSIDPVVQSELRADRLLSRSYRDQSTEHVAGLFVAWFQSQRGGQSQPHSPKVCLPGSGWTPEETGNIALETAVGRITINRFAVVNHGQHSIILYWYQTPRRVIANEWAAKFWLLPDVLRDRRTDTALVRVVVSASAARDEAASRAANRFVRQVYPLLRMSLPR